MIVHSPNRYLATLLLVFFSILQIRKTNKLCCTRDIFAPFAGYFVAHCIGCFAFIQHFSNLNNLAWACFNLSTVVSAFALSVMLDKDDILSGLKLFIIVESGVLMAQYLILAVKFGTIFVFSAYAGAGDALGGTLFGFSSPLAVSLMMISLYFLFIRYSDNSVKNSLLYAAAAALFSTFPGMMSAVAVFCLTVALVFVAFSVRELFLMEISRLTLFVIPVTFASLGILVFFLGENIEYMGNIFLLMLNFDNPPIKILAIQKYYQMIASNYSYLWVGSGLGNFTSRAGAMVSGQYFEHQPFFVSITPSTEMSKFILPFWNRGMFNEMVGGSIGNSMINEPFNLHLSVLAECGILGFLIWETSQLIAAFRSLASNNRSYFAILVFSFGIFFTNDWLAYPNFALVLFMLAKASSRFRSQIETRSVFSKGGLHE
ncbi:MAG: hypothetical protein IPP74_15040 [Alphaproteobacteria bacterium]|nr:hypothetical protein [Alphaproteobacteria bacterium]